MSEAYTTLEVDLASIKVAKVSGDQSKVDNACKIYQAHEREFLPSLKNDERKDLAFKYNAILNSENERTQ